MHSLLALLVALTVLSNPGLANRRHRAPTATWERGPLFPTPEKPVIVVGLEKTGTSSISAYFKCGHVETKHWVCAGSTRRRRQTCGHCVYKNLRAGRPPLESCGGNRTAVWAQLDVTSKPLPGSNSKLCFWPQVEALDQLKLHYPNATWVLNLRPVENWIRSVNHWVPDGMSLKERIKQCAITGLPVGTGGEDSELTAFFIHHAERIRAFSKAHGITLVELDIESPSAGNVMETHFGISSDSCWKQANANHKSQAAAGADGNAQPLQ